MSINNQLKETSRVEAFSDGVFCVAVTLLAFEVGIDSKDIETNKGLFNSLLGLWPKYLAYLLSFINVLLAWIGHHSLFKQIRETDNLVMISNGLLLLLIALVPLPTKTLGLCLNTGAFKAAVFFYTFYFVLISLAFRLLWYAASRNKQLLVDTISAIEIRKITRNENTGLAYNALIAALALTSPIAALLLSFAMWIYWITRR